MNRYRQWGSGLKYRVQELINKILQQEHYSDLHSPSVFVVLSYASKYSTVHNVLTVSTSDPQVTQNKDPSNIFPHLAGSLFTSNYPPEWATPE